MAYVPAGFSPIIISEAVATELHVAGRLSRMPPVRGDGTCLIALPADERKALDSYVVREGIDYSEAFRRFHALERSGSPAARSGGEG